METRGLQKKPPLWRRALCKLGVHQRVLDRDNVHVRITRCVGCGKVEAHHWSQTWRGFDGGSGGD